MSTKKKGFLVLDKEYRQHLRKYGRRVFWKRHRKVEKASLRKYDEN